MNYEAIQKKIRQYQDEGKQLFTSSSFQTHSTVLLHIISRIDKSIPVYFINTGFLFPDTIRYKDQLASLLDLNIVEVKSSIPKSQQKDMSGHLLFSSDPDYCCSLNKIQPLEPVLAKYDVWINGVRADQTAVRQQMKVEEQSKYGTIRFHPMLDWSSKEIYAYIREYKIPKHPLDDKGYMSIGCEPCTRKIIAGDERSARWFGLNKTECGLNTDLVIKK